MLSARDAAMALLQERAAFNDAAVRAAGAPGRAEYEGRKAVQRRRKLAEAGLTPEQERALAGDLEQAGSRSMWNYGPGWNDYRARAAMDVAAAGGGFDPTRWGLPSNYRL